MRTKNIASGFAFLAFGALYAHLTAQLPLRMVGNVPGPSFFPWVLTWCFLGFSGVLLIQGFMTPPGRPAKPESERAISRRTAAALLFLAIYLGALPYMGFLLTTPLLFGALMWAAGEARPLYVAGWSVGMTVLFYAMIQHILQVPLPAAPAF